jgi:hypothetical protein
VFIDELSGSSASDVQLLVDDCLLFKHARIPDGITLKQYLETLEKWEEDWHIISYAEKFAVGAIQLYM